MLSFKTLKKSLFTKNAGSLTFVVVSQKDEGAIRWLCVKLTYKMLPWLSHQSNLMD